MLGCLVLSSSNYQPRPTGPNLWAPKGTRARNRHRLATRLLNDFMEWGNSTSAHWLLLISIPTRTLVQIFIQFARPCPKASNHWPCALGIYLSCFSQTTFQRLCDGNEMKQHLQKNELKQQFLQVVPELLLHSEKVRMRRGLSGSLRKRR